LSHQGIHHQKSLPASTPPPVVDGYADAVIYQNSDEIGRAAIQLLVSLIHHNEFGIPRARREILVEGEWVDGRSLPP